jgi:hypothetical protein
MNAKSKRIILLLIVSKLVLTDLTGFVYGQEPVDYVNPNIGTIGHLLTATTPDVQLPRGMIRLIPTTTPGIRDVYLADKIYAFSTISLGLIMIWKKQRPITILFFLRTLTYKRNIRQQHIQHSTGLLFRKLKIQTCWYHCLRTRS